MKSLGIIPARFNSTRFPGKPLVDIDGKSMIRRVYEQAKKCGDLSQVIVATDHEGILNHVHEFGGEAVMTASSHKTGTERCAEVLELLQKREENFEIVVNIQGDEPFINPQQISEVIRLFSNSKMAIATLARRIFDPESLKDPNVVKLVVDHMQRVLYFSRAVIPYVRDGYLLTDNMEIPFFEHVGIYGFRKTILQELIRLPVSSLERAESLEQLRWLQNGFAIYVCETNYDSISIDTPADLRKLSNRKS